MTRTNLETLRAAIVATDSPLLRHCESEIIQLRNALTRIRDLALAQEGRASSQFTHARAALDEIIKHCSREDER